MQSEQELCVLLIVIKWGRGGTYTTTSRFQDQKATTSRNGDN